MSDIQILSKTDQHDEEKGLEAHLREENVREQAKRARELVQGLHDELNARAEDLKDGLSYLDMKNDTLLSYMIDVCNILLKKVQGKSIADHPSVERCVEYRVILEKIKAIDLRLAYQLNKIITLPDDATEEGQRIDVNNLDVQIESTDDEDDSEDEGEPDQRKGRKGGRNDVEDEDDDGEDDEDDEKEIDEEESSDDGGEGGDDIQIGRKINSKERPKQPVGVYRPPKLRSVAYTDGKADQARRKDYSDFYRDDDADEIVDETHRNEDKERTKLEEDNFTRFRDNPKRAKRKMKQMKQTKGNKRVKGGGKKRGGRH